MKIKIGLFIYFIGLSFNISAQDTLLLVEAIKIGLENNFSIKIARNNVRIAENNNTLGNAGFLPTLSLDGSYTRSDNHAYQIRRQTIRRPDRPDSINEVVLDQQAIISGINAGLRLDWTIFDGFNMFTTREQLIELEKLGRMQAEINLDNLVANIIVTYFNIVQQEKLENVLQKAIELSHIRRELAQNRLQFGAGSELTVLQATVDLNADSSRLVQQIASTQVARAELNNLLGRDPSTGFEVEKGIILNTDIIYDEFLESMKGQNPQLQEAKINNSVAALQVKSAQSWFYPRINVFAEYGYTRSENPTGFAILNRNYGPSYGLTASWTLFSGFNGRRLLQNTKITLQNSQELMQQVQLEIETEYYKIFNQYQANIKLANLELENLKVAEQNVEIALETYRLGRISDFDFRETQQRLIDAEGRLISAEYLAKQAETELLRLSGRLMDENI